jgi:hypothetical protein
MAKFTYEIEWVKKHQRMFARCPTPENVRKITLATGAQIGISFEKAQVCLRYIELFRSSDRADDAKMGCQLSKLFRARSQRKAIRLLPTNQEFFALLRKVFTVCNMISGTQAGMQTFT